LATSVALAPGSISAATHASFSKRDHRRRLSTDVMTSIRFMALWLSLVLATLSYAAHPRAQGGAFWMDTTFRPQWGNRQNWIPALLLANVPREDREIKNRASIISVARDFDRRRHLVNLTYPDRARRG
jgi:hypothetical protein